MTDLITIDGSRGEGGGQMLRSSLALSMATGRPFRMVNVRAGRPKPGLMRQHLTSVEAAARITGAEVSGALVGSREITFTPGPVRPGEYHCPIGTAGSCTLVLQAILPALLRAPGPSTIIVEGGTHNRGAPPLEFLQLALLPLLAECGSRVSVRLERYGFYPAGGGRIVVDIEPCHAPAPLDLRSRGERTHTRARAIVSRLPKSIAAREIRVLMARLQLDGSETEIIAAEDATGPGNAVVVELGYERGCEVFTAIGEIQRSAEQVAQDAVDLVREHLVTRAPVGEHLADQLMVPLALLAGGTYATARLSSHAETNLDVLRAFGVRAEVAPEPTIAPHASLVTIAPLAT